ITATTEVVISEKSKPEFASDERSGMAFSRMSRIRMTGLWTLATRWGPGGTGSIPQCGRKSAPARHGFVAFDIRRHVVANRARVGPDAVALFVETAWRLCIQGGITNGAPA